MTDQVVVSRAGIRALIRLTRLGATGRRLAERVEDGNAQWIDVLHERDPSPEAASLRRDAGESVSALIDELAEDDPELARHRT